MIRSIAISGPTASGKTALSLFLAEELSGEIISADSMQIYRYMDIGTAKATEEERRSIPHHMIDFLDPGTSFSTEDYRALALKCAEDIVSRGKLPIFVGGTGLYLDTLMRGSSPLSPPSSLDVMDELLNRASTEEGKRELYEELQSVDPKSAEKTHMNNVRRVARALEIYRLTGKTKTYFDEMSRTSSPDIELLMITLDFHNRENLYNRVDTRVDLMMESGLLGEVKALVEKGYLSCDTTASQAIGYKEIKEHLDGGCTLDEAVEKIKLASRRYAKRQLTWFRHKGDAVRLYLDLENGEMKDRSGLKEELLALAKGFVK